MWKYLMLALILFTLSPFESIIESSEGELDKIYAPSKLKYRKIETDDGLDIEFIYDITAALSEIIFSEYDEEKGEIAKGRGFGTPGEIKAAKILYENFSNLGLYTKYEQIQNIQELPDVASKLEVLSYEMSINYIKTKQSETVDCFIAPSWRGPRDHPNQINYNFSFKELKVKPKPNIKSLRDMKYLYDYEKDDYLFIMEDYSYNPYLPPPPLKKLLNMIFSPYSDLLLFWDGIKQIAELNIWYNYFPRCQGLIRYDFNNDTHNMVYPFNWSLPVIFINGSIGKKILRERDNITIDFYVHQRYNKSVTSHNVIGQLNGTDSTKTVIIDCLYDSWWCQGTGDSAIGMGIVTGIAKYFHDHNITPKYNIKFIGFGGEEYGMRGAKHYEVIHRDENIIYVIDLNQLGFTQESPKLYLEIISNNYQYLNEIWEIAQRTDYVEKTDSAGIRKIWMPLGAPSNDQPFAQNRPLCKTVSFLKGLNWKFHHRDGLNHREGDVLDYFNWTDVSVTSEIILNITRHVTTTP